MSWTTVCDLEMKAYQGNRVLDASGYDNDATALGAVATHSGYVTFGGLDAQLEVPVRDESLARFAAVRVQALVRPAPITRRFNLVEGWMSFALVIQDDARLIASIYDGQNWVALDSGATRVSPDRWARISFEYDGVSIASIALDGVTVASRLDMPAGIRQPQQVITLGHWPRGDDRYTLAGDLGHVRIEKRDHEDFWRDAAHIAFCRRRLTPEQAVALDELRFIAETLTPAEQARLLAAAEAQSDRTRQFLHDLRALNERGAARLRRLADRLRAAWCCSYNASEALAALTEYMRAISGPPGSPEAAQFQTTLDKLFEIALMCAFPGPPYERVRELCEVLFPELATFEADLRAIADSV